MVFRWRASDDPHIVVFGSSLPSSIKKKLSKLDPFLDPRMQLSNYVLCAMSAFMRQCTTCYPTLKTARGMKAADLIFMSAADIISRQVWPRPGPTKMFNVCIHNKGADKNVRYPGWFATLLVSYNKVGVKHLQTCGKDVCKFWYVCHRGWFQGLLLFSLRWML